MFKYIFIDESGDLGVNKGCSKYLILSALIITNPQALDRIIKNIRRNKFRKELKKANEIKANKSSDNLRIYMLKKLNELKDVKIFYIILEKKKLISEYLKSDKHKLYNYVAGKLAKQLPLNDDSVEIRIDKSKGKQLLQEDFNNYFIKCLKEKPIKTTIEHSYSHNWAGLQFADILSWACFQKFEYQNDSYVDIIQLDQEVFYVW